MFISGKHGPRSRFLWISDIWTNHAASRQPYFRLLDAKKGINNHLRMICTWHIARTGENMHVNWTYKNHFPNVYIGKYTV